jgi:hypothetical protein
MVGDEAEDSLLLGGPSADEAAPAVLIATILRQEGSTGVHTHVRELRRHLGTKGIGTTLVTPLSRGRLLSGPVFGLRFALEQVSGSASVVWYRHWHELFLRRGLRHELARVDDAVVYAQGPLEARAALRARRGAHQRVVMAVHFHESQADEWVGKSFIRRGGAVFRAIRALEREVIPSWTGSCTCRARRETTCWDGSPKRAPSPRP